MKLVVVHFIFDLNCHARLKHNIWKGKYFFGWALCLILSCINCILEVPSSSMGCSHRQVTQLDMCAILALSKFFHTPFESNKKVLTMILVIWLGLLLLKKAAVAHSLFDFNCHATLKHNTQNKNIFGPCFLLFYSLLVVFRILIKLQGVTVDS